jgi:hypothetical protein
MQPKSAVIRRQGYSPKCSTWPPNAKTMFMTATAPGTRLDASVTDDHSVCASGLGFLWAHGLGTISLLKCSHQKHQPSMREMRA